MALFIAKTFTSSIARLQASERASVREAAEMYRANPAHPGLRKHRLDRCRDAGFWSLRCTREIRAILHQSGYGTVFCYADHHDKAYAWAEKRTFSQNPTTGTMQVVEFRDLFVPDTRSKPAPAARIQQPRLFANVPPSEFAWLGVPTEWIEDVRAVHSDDELLALIPHLPEEAGEALLTLAGGGRPKPVKRPDKEVNPFLTPDACRRFHVVDSQQELEDALSGSWDDWRIFLHPDQRALTQTMFDGDARVCGGPGTGKTVVALHRAVHLASHDASSRVLLTTISRALAASLAKLVIRLAGSEARVADRITVTAIDALPELLLGGYPTELPVAEEIQVREALSEASRSLGLSALSVDFLFEEWGQVIEACGVADSQAYAALDRQGRLVRLTRIQRQEVWMTVERATGILSACGLTPPFRQVRAVAAMLADGRLTSPFNYIITDECQDLRHEHLVLLNAMRKTPQSLFFVGDLGQRVRHPLVSWRSAGIDIKGRSHVLKVNYRTTHQIRLLADQLVAGQFQDLDGQVEDRRHHVSVYAGLAPSIREYAGEEDEQFGVARWLEQLFACGVKPHECCIFVRDGEVLPRAQAAVALANVPCVLLDNGEAAAEGSIALATMPHAEGLEFRAVAVMACDAWTVPLQSRLDGAMQGKDAIDIRNMERQLLYVAVTRARDWLLITGTTPISEFLQDIRQ